MEVQARFANHREFHQSALYVAVAATMGGSLSPWLGVGTAPLLCSAFAGGVVLRGRWKSGNLPSSKHVAMLLVASALGYWVSCNLFGGLNLSLWGKSIVSGAGFAAPLVLAMALRHASLKRDQLTTRFLNLSVASHDELADLGKRCVQVWSDMKAALPWNDERCEAIADAGTQICKIADDVLFRDGIARRAAALAKEEAAGIERRLQAATDEQAKQRYREARTAVSARGNYALEIIGDNEGDIAKIHQLVATMEQLLLAVLRQRKGASLTTRAMIDT